jgi:hypothetical protein
LHHEVEKSILKISSTNKSMTVQRIVIQSAIAGFLKPSRFAERKHPPASLQRRTAAIRIGLTMILFQPWACLSAQLKLITTISNAFMKKTCVVIILQLLLFAVHAQKNERSKLQVMEPVNPVRDTQEYLGYIIRLMPCMPSLKSTGSYGFDILKDNKPVVHQFKNPLPLSPGGIQKKQDAYKIAQWMIREYRKTGHWQSKVPPHITYDLRLQPIN